MSGTSDKFKKKPRQKTPAGKRVPVSAEAKEAYEELIRAREERERTYERHLPADSKLRR